jgi:SPP1 gp7 family putative phage head morphogenesis protein
MPTAPSQLIEQASRHQLFIEGYKTHEAKELLAVLRSIEAGLIGRLSRSNIPDWTRTRLENQLKAYRDYLAKGFEGELLPEIRSKLKEFAVYEAGFEVRSLGNVAPGFNFTVPTDAQIFAALRTSPLSVRGADNGALLDSVLDNWSRRQIDAVTNGIRAGAVQGQTTAQVISGLNQTVFKGAEDALAGVVRTTLQHSASVAREQTWRANSDIVKRVRWVSTLDSRTSDQCQAMDGRVFKIDEGPRPPIHWGCRSTTVGVLDDRYSFLDDGATRSSRNPETGRVESVPAKETYFQWLKRQPQAVQNQAIGPTRATLLRDGGLSAQRFSDLQLGKQFQPLTLVQMRELDPVAFIRSGIDT